MLGFKDILFKHNKVYLPKWLKTVIPFLLKKIPAPQNQHMKPSATKSKSYLFYLHYSLNTLAVCNEDNTFKYNWTLGFNMNCVAYTEVYTKWLINHILITVLDKVKREEKQFISSSKMNNSAEV